MVWVSTSGIWGIEASSDTATSVKITYFTKPFIVGSDARGIDLGAVLMLEGRPITFFSEALKSRSQLLFTYEKDFLALVTAVQRWRSQNSEGQVGFPLEGYEKWL